MLVTARSGLIMQKSRSTSLTGLCMVHLQANFTKPRIIHGQIADQTIFCGAFKEYVSSRCREPVHRYFYGDALPSAAGFHDADAQSKREHRWAGGWLCSGDTEYRAGFFRHAVG